MAIIFVQVHTCLSQLVIVENLLFTHPHAPSTPKAAEEQWDLGAKQKLGSQPILPHNALSL